MVTGTPQGAAGVRASFAARVAAGGGRAWRTFGAPLEARQVAGKQMPSALTVGARSLSFSLGASNMATFGLWQMKSESMNVGWEVGLGLNLSSDETDPEFGTGTESSTTPFAISVGPSFRRYIDMGYPVVPFVQTGVAARYAHLRDRTAPTDDPDDEEVDSSNAAGLAGTFGLGLEWFQVERFSVSAYTGLGVNALYEWGDAPGGSSKGWSLDFGTFTTGVLFRLYFLPGSPSI
jgi:hypothetical protein